MTKKTGVLIRKAFLNDALIKKSDFVRKLSSLPLDLLIQILTPS